MKAFSGVLFLAVSLIARLGFAAYAVADLQVSSDPNAPTHIVVAGQGLEAGSLWMDGAHTQALVYKDRNPNDNVKLVTAVNIDKKDKYLSTLTTWGYKNIKYSASPFLGPNLVSVFVSTRLIASLDFIGHNGGFLGFALEDEGSDHRFFEADVDQMVGKVHFTKDAYIRLFGCNTGWYLAPYMAKKLGVPAAGTLTSADVEIVAVDNNWYYDESDYWPRNEAQASVNRITYSAAQNCYASGGCVRLRPINTSYVGQHGTYVGALPFLKFFCGTVEQNDCFRRMAYATKYFVGVNPMKGDLTSGQKPSFKNFEMTMADMFCPASLNLQTRADCAKMIANHLTGVSSMDPAYSSMPTDVPLMTCNFLSCQFKVGQDSAGGDIFVSTGPAGAHTLVNEINAYAIGYKLLGN